MIALDCKKLTVAIGDRILVRNLDITLQSGDFVCLLGPNGVGKTLTLHTMAGLRSPHSGSILLDGHSMRKIERPAIARRLGLLLQSQDDAFPITVLETVLMGRHSHLGIWQWENRRDLDIAREALDAMDLRDLEQRASGTLSGGERRRLSLATLLAQNPSVLLLDEPMNHLDPLHKLTVLAKLAELANAGKSILASLHDPALASHYATRVLLLFGDGDWQFGPTDELLTPENMERLYHTPFERFSGNGKSALLPV
jgi:iron complex transport system ATP-binding protein